MAADQEASQNVADGPEGFTTRHTIGDRVIFTTAEGNIDGGTVQSITFDAAGIFYDIELADAPRTVVRRIASSGVEPDRRS